MKHITKKSEPIEFSDWKALANEDWQPTFSSLSGQIKDSVTTALMKEQGYICCYCERRLQENDSHIEHFNPQKDHSCDPLDFDNMLCSCQNQLDKGEPRHCGNLKGCWFDPILLVSPFDFNCESKFSYTADGEISPADPKDKAANQTINKLGLDIPKLNSLRKNAIEPFLADLNPSELQQFVNGYLQQDSDGRFGVFWTTIKYLFA